MHSTTSDRLRETLLEGGVLNDVQKRVVLDYQRAVGGTIDEIVVRLGFMTEEEVRAITAEAERLEVTEAMVARDLVARIPVPVLRGYGVIPVMHEGAPVLAAEEACVEPLVLEEIWGLLGMQLAVVQAEAGTVMAAVEKLDCQPRDAGEAPGAPLPAVSLRELVALLVAKGILTAEDLRAQAARDPAPELRSES